MCVLTLFYKVMYKHCNLKSRIYLVLKLVIVHFIIKAEFIEMHYIYEYIFTFHNLRCNTVSKSDTQHGNCQYCRYTLLN